MCQITHYIHSSSDHILDSQNQLIKLKANPPLQSEKIDLIINSLFSTLSEEFKAVKKERPSEMEAKLITSCTDLLKQFNKLGKTTSGSPQEKYDYASNVLMLFSNDFLEMENEIAQKTSFSKGDEIHKLTKKRAQLHDKINRSIDDLSKAYEKDHKKLDEAEKLHAENVAWKNKLQTFTTLMIGLRKQIQVLFDQNTTSDKKLTTHTEGLNALEKDITTFSQQVDGDTEKVNKAKELILSQFESIEAIKKDIDVLAIETAEYDEDLNEANEEYLKLKSDVTRLAGGIKKLDGKFDQIEKTLADTDCKVDELKEKADSLPDPVAEGPLEESVILSLLMKLSHKVIDLAIYMSLWLLEMFEWTMAAFDDSTSKLFSATKTFSTHLKTQISPFIGKEPAEIVAHPITITGAGVFALFYSRLVRRTAACLFGATIIYQISKKYLFVKSK